MNALPNDALGGIAGVALPERLRALLAPQGALHRAQLSVVHPGHPRRDAGESAAAHAFRRARDAAHLDGLLPEVPARRRYRREPHAIILGLPLTAVTAQTSPFVVWEGSHHLMRAAMQAALGPDPDRWGETDVTDAYQAGRAQVFGTCPRRVVKAGPGQAIPCHRLAIHGVAPWEGAEQGPVGGRMIAWFRPLLRHTSDWLAAD